LARWKTGICGKPVIAKKRPRLSLKLGRFIHEVLPRDWYSIGVIVFGWLRRTTTNEFFSSVGWTVTEED
jgi:hypothetical protein